MNALYITKKPPEVYEGYASDKGVLLKYSKGIKTEVHKNHQPINILRLGRIYDKAPKNFWFKSPNKIKNYVPVRVIVEYL